MKIKTKIRIVVILSFCAVFIVSVILFLSSKRVDKESEEAERADALVRAIAEFNIFVFEHSIHHEERPLMQARLKYDSIAGLLKKEEFEFPEEQEILDKISHNYTIIGSNLSQIVDIHKSQRPGKKEDVQAQELEKSLENSILFRSQEMVSDAFHLAAMIRQGEERAHGIIHNLIILFVAILTVGFAAISILLSRSVTNPIIKLHKGTEIIGSGNLDYKTAIDSKDEIGQLSRAFDSMTENLKVITISRDEYVSILRTSVDGFWIADTRGHILDVNDAYCTMTGYSRDELFSMCVQDFEASEKPEDTARHIEKVIKAGGDRFETRHRCKDGRIIDAEVSVNYMDVKGGRFFVFIRDVTERRRAEENLRKVKNELERSNKELEQFAYIASHDLQEPARTVSSFVQLLAKRYKGRLDRDADDFIDFAVQGSDRMQRMITDLLAYSRVGTKGKPFAEIDCNLLFNQVLSGLRMLVEENKAEIIFPLGPLPVIMADETQIMQLFQNLISNAIKFRGSDSPRIEIFGKNIKDLSVSDFGLRISELTGEKEDKYKTDIFNIRAEMENGWIFSFKDNGIGFEQKYEEKIFDIFKRLHPIGKYTGSGIGLAVCRRIVERHGGRIWAESEPGKGTVFYFTIPMKG